MKNKIKMFFIISGVCVSSYIAMAAGNYIHLVYSSWTEGYNISLNVDYTQSAEKFDVTLAVYNSRWRWYLHIPCYKETIIHDSVNPEHLSNWNVISVKDGMIRLKNNEQSISVITGCK
ncbi:hypothetical protein [Klebsiella spallanzanii]|uniref:hypothetical protein n=1 Tax=Klebsiella spallanzanii TaxID=2587528 RepID=UPI0011599A36|nr:hypothetical protein [Klebsiella spallanzanii]VUS31154.1 hypothetical protein SB6419_02214 [Klebsiella spallanzanii]